MKHSTMDQANPVDLVVTRIYDAPVEEVWSYWIDPAKVRQWWGPNGFTCPVADMDVRVGGTSFVVMHSPEYGDHYRSWHYEDVVPHQLIAYVRKATDADRNEVDPTTVGMPPDFPRAQRHVVRFEALGVGRTMVTFTEEGWPPIPLVELSRVGLEQCLDKIHIALASRA